MIAWLAGLSPKGGARIARIFEFLGGTFSAGSQVAILGSLVVTGNAAATTHNILANKGRCRLGFLILVAGVGTVTPLSTNARFAGLPYVSSSLFGVDRLLYT
jgi:hypothetical protein